MKKFIFGISIILLLAVSTSASAGYPDRNGTVAYWTFNEGIGTIAHDISGNGNNGTIYGASWTSGKVGGALQYDGSGDYVDIGSDQSYSFIRDDFTVETWIKTNSDSNDNEIVAKGGSCADGGYKLITYGGFLRGSFNNQYASPYYDIVSAKKINDGRWHHVIFVAKGLKTSNTYTICI